MIKYNLSDKSEFKDIKEACYWLMLNTNFKLSAFYNFFGLHQNTLTNWQKKIDSGKITKVNKNKFVDDFLNSEYNNTSYKKHKTLDIDIVGEIKYIILNTNFPRYVISRFYGIDDNYISQLKSGYAWENVMPIKPDNKRLEEIKNGLEEIDKNIQNEIRGKKQAAAWLFLYTGLDVLEISHLLELNYLHVYRVYQKGKNKKSEWEKLAQDILNINYKYDFLKGKYFHNIIRK